MADLQKRGGYTSRKAKEQRAYRALVAAGGTGAAGVVTLVLAIAGTMGLAIPIILLIVSAVFVFRFMSITGLR